MPTSTRARRAAAAGFTLVELMVVLVLLGLAATAVVLTLRPADAARAEAVMLAGRIAALRDEAILRGRPTGLSLSPTGFAFEQYRAGQWAPLSSRRFDGRTRFADGVTARIAGERQGVRFDNLGMPSAPTVFVLDDPGGRTATVSIAANGAVEAR
ncbi:GspH/FimT family protein [Sphingomicrobium astaxanthinifaciens]|uniref:GspH/FimT family protein n=1 Tax=Sphingomicrobium astaxanthinifaciens TaxID=1227949 RepID=UPI001FCA5CD5|nr:GspH/FimT family pseudopilin [Sphingomicrobium astaxanthinifaciens]MCJ7421074.1 GspH/FimT family pseudopilin [Sphingomicrobium astaxanthinifaciens]